LHIDDPSGPFARSANFRRQLGRFERRLDRDGVSFEWLGPGQVDDGLVADLFRLHRRRRDALDATTSLDTRHERLLRACCATATDTHGPAAVVARAAGQVVAMLFGFVWKDTFSAYQSGWDPAHATNSIGSVLVHQAIRCAAENDVRTFDFLRGTEPYKYRFGAVDTFDASFLVIGDAAGRALLLERALRRGVRRVIPARETPRTDHRDDQPR
jgi:CelD/BcsL family acetyltransferase involved in cellulose biosynthesis